jgi:hypothetical protein
MDQHVQRDNRRPLRGRRLRLEKQRASLPEGAALKEETQLELWSDEELQWLEVPPELQHELAHIISRLSGPGPLILCWRRSDGERVPFSARKYLAAYRRAKAEAEAEQ